jgi:hypothetical protein
VYKDCCLSCSVIPRRNACSHENVAHEHSACVRPCWPPRTLYDMKLHLFVFCRPFYCMCAPACTWRPFPTSSGSPNDETRISAQEPPFGLIFCPSEVEPLNLQRNSSACISRSCFVRPSRCANGMRWRAWVDHHRARLLLPVRSRAVPGKRRTKSQSWSVSAKR